MDILTSSDFLEVDQHGNTCLHHAFKNEDYDIVELLLEYSSKYKFSSVFYMTNKDGLAPLDYAIGKGHLDIVSLALNSDNLDQINDKGQHKLHFACLHNRNEWVKILLRHFQYKSIDVNFPDIDGNTALHYACKNGNVKIVESFLRHEEEFNVDIGAWTIDRCGRKPIDILLEARFELEIEFGSFVNCQNALMTSCHGVLYLAHGKILLHLHVLSHYSQPILLFLFLFSYIE
mgnify:CR=1 FL=1